jgi:hypothetical protein
VVAASFRGLRGRKRVGLKFFFIVTTTEAVAVALALYLHHEVFVQ